MGVDPIAKYLSSSPVAMGLFLMLLGAVALFSSDTLADIQVRFGAGEGERAFQTWIARVVGVALIIIGLYRLATHLL